MDTDLRAFDVVGVFSVGNAECKYMRVREQIVGVDCAKELNT